MFQFDTLKLYTKKYEKNNHPATYCHTIRYASCCIVHNLLSFWHNLCLKYYCGGLKMKPIKKRGIIEYGLLMWFLMLCFIAVISISSELKSGSTYIVAKNDLEKNGSTIELALNE